MHVNFKHLLNIYLIAYNTFFLFVIFIMLTLNIYIYIISIENITISSILSSKK